MIKKILTSAFFLTLAACGGEKIINNYYSDVEEQETYVGADDCNKKLVYEDYDGDGFGGSNSLEICVGDNISNFVANNQDCDDSNANSFPGNPEVCDNIDNDCDGIVDKLTRICETICESGLETCENGVWSECSAKEPKTEILNGSNDDCNGFVDDKIKNWTYEIGTCFENSISISPDGNIVLLGEGNEVYSLNPQDPLLNTFNVKVHGPVDFRTAAISQDNEIYVGGRLKVFKFNPSNSVGLIWDYKLFECVSDFGSQTDDVSGLNSLAIQTSGNVLLSVKLKDIDLIFDDYCGYIQSLNNEGNSFWKYNIGFNQAGITIDLQNLILSNYKNKIYGLDSNGNYLFSENLSYTPTGSPVVGSEDLVYIRSFDHLMAFNLTNLVEAWDIPFEADSEISLPVVDENGVIYFGSKEGSVYALNKDKTEKWFSPINGSTISPTISDEGLLLVSSDNGLIALDKETGNKVWSLETVENKGSILALRPGVVAFGNSGNIFLCNKEDGNLYSFKGNYKLNSESVWPTFRHDFQRSGNALTEYNF
ncbi:PQQ-binding-like beta-propeller repeat protein [Candidatus Woesearchaeota archaeon]|nr:PQQ-binding-like beta-propeller repeat protein [Candidatus Woesearchaeota archaeon]